MTGGGPSCICCDLLLCLLGASAALPEAADAGPYPVKTHADIEFARSGGVPLQLDIHLSGGVVVMFIHGVPAQIHDCKGALRWLRAFSGQ